MRSEPDQLLEDLEYIRSNAGSVAPDHPKAKKWVAEVMSYLGREGNASGLKKFERLEFVRHGAEVCSRHNVTQGSIRKYKADLDKVEVILEKMRPLDKSSADEKMRELFLNPDEESREAETPEEAGVETVLEKTLVENKGVREKEPVLSEKAMEEKIESNFEAITKRHLSGAAREKVIDGLMGELSAHMKSPDPDWEKIQGVMGGLLGLKKTGELLERLKAEVKNPGAKWETVRQIMSQLWSIKKEIIIELLPRLLKS
ncbi:MAG: hypothetical protein GTO24_08590 [candidate division Zixibacteria bacterium]|nr:hypothetical protein [candidate division Zixibacteria bacterium]